MRRQEFASRAPTPSLVNPNAYGLCAPMRILPKVVLSELDPLGIK
jgi:hypothetical protein